MKNRKGSIAAFLTLGLVVVGTLITLGTSLFVSNKNSNLASNSRAAGACIAPNTTKSILMTLSCSSASGCGSYEKYVSQQEKTPDVTHRLCCCKGTAAVSAGGSGGDSTCKYPTKDDCTDSGCPSAKCVSTGCSGAKKYKCTNGSGGGVDDSSVTSPSGCVSSITNANMCRQEMGDDWRIINGKCCPPTNIPPGESDSSDDGGDSDPLDDSCWLVKCVGGEPQKLQYTSSLSKFNMPTSSCNDNMYSGGGKAAIGEAKADSILESLSCDGTEETFIPPDNDPAGQTGDNGNDLNDDLKLAGQNCGFEDNCEDGYECVANAGKTLKAHTEGKCKEKNENNNTLADQTCSSKKTSTCPAGSKLAGQKFDYYKLNSCTGLNIKDKDCYGLSANSCASNTWSEIWQGECNYLATSVPIVVPAGPGAAGGATGSCKLQNKRCPGSEGKSVQLWYKGVFNITYGISENSCEGKFEDAMNSLCSNNQSSSEISLETLYETPVMPFTPANFNQIGQAFSTFAENPVELTTKPILNGDFTCKNYGQTFGVNNYIPDYTVTDWLNRPTQCHSTQDLVENLVSNQ